MIPIVEKKALRFAAETAETCAMILCAIPETCRAKKNIRPKLVRVALALSNFSFLLLLTENTSKLKENAINPS